MRAAAGFAFLLLAGLADAATYGEQHPVGETLQTACVAVINFDEELRSSPRLHGTDAFVGYFSYGAGMPSGHVFLVQPVAFDPDQPVGALLQSATPRREDWWLQATLQDGRLAEGEVFEALVPPKQYNPEPNATVVEREAILVRGSIHAACGKHYLVAVQGTPMLDEAAEWPSIRKDYDTFVANLKWPAPEDATK